MADGQPNTPQQSQSFCDPSADIIFQSSDRVLFRMHKKHLEVASGGFPVLENITVDNDPVPLQEPSEVLELLFQFIRPPTEAMNQRHPDLEGVDPLLFLQFAEAAEKYIVYGAMNLAMTCMRRMLEHRANALDILEHADRHGYPDLADKAAPFAACHQDHVLAEKLTSHVLRKLILYRSQWLLLGDVFLKAWNTYDQAGYGKCARLQDLKARYLDRLRTHPATEATTVPTADTSRPCPWSGMGCGCANLPNKATTSLLATASTFKSFNEIKGCD